MKRRALLTRLAATAAVVAAAPFMAPFEQSPELLSSTTIRWGRIRVESWAWSPGTAGFERALRREIDGLVEDMRADLARELGPAGARRTIERLDWLEQDGQRWAATEGGYEARLFARV